MFYNPYDLISLRINKKPTYGRPVAFDSEVVDQKLMKNSKGEYVKPIQLSTTCMDCGQGFVFDINLKDLSPPFAVLEINCPLCRPKINAVTEVFRNPFKEGLIKENELDPQLMDINNVKSETGNVSERLNNINIDTNSSDELKALKNLKTNKEIKTEKAKSPTKPKPKAKKTSKKLKNPLVEESEDLSNKPLQNDFVIFNKNKLNNLVEPADGIDEEKDFEDDDLVE